ncbi:MAG: glycosyltransferase [Acidimicrobiales bacterium]|nr:glycosyltransferase [Acidimicrobiales bacterium]
MCFFGTYDEDLHPRIRVVREGLGLHGHDIRVVNRPLGVSTAQKVQIASFPPLGVLLVVRLLVRWVQLLIASRGVSPAVVVVGYMGHFDIHFARLRFPRSYLVLDHLTGLGETARDRNVDTGVRGRVLDALDGWALRRADLVLCDTDEQATQVIDRSAAVEVVPVGAPLSWLEAGADAPAPTGPLKVVFVGLFTPLQGASVIAQGVVEALRTAELECTFVGTGQDLDAAKTIVGSNPNVTWNEWIPAAELPGFVASFDVSLGIVGTSPKARRVVPNKVYQGLAAGTVVITSDTPPQRRLKKRHSLDQLMLVPPGDPSALASTLQRLADSPEELRSIRRDGADAVGPTAVTGQLSARLS